MLLFPVGVKTHDYKVARFGLGRKTEAAGLKWPYIQPEGRRAGMPLAQGRRHLPSEVGYLSLTDQGPSPREEGSRR